jgi:hypothetical protein
VLTVDFFSGDKLLKRISVGRNGIATLDGGEQYYKISPEPQTMSL